MSKFSKTVEAKRDNQKIARPMPVYIYERVEESRDDFDLPNYKYKYTFGADFRIQALAYTSEEVEFQKKLAVEEMVYHLFGEFRVPIIESIRDCASNGMMETADRLRKVLDDMFEV